MSTSNSSALVPGKAVPVQTPAPISMPMLMVLSGTAASWGEICSIPFDTAKVRLQIQNNAAGSAPQYRGLLHCLGSMVKHEGILSPWRGVTAGIQRQCAFAPIRIGLYEPVRNVYMGKDFKGDPTILQKIAAGLTTSAIGITVASPTDVVKVRLQAEGRLPAGATRRYNGVLDAYRKIIKLEGVRGLWTGYGPNLARNCVVNAAELVAYDQAKQMLRNDFHLPESPSTHVMAALCAGLAATLLGSPVDVVKTRVMNGGGAFSGPFDCAAKMLKNEGILSFYKGFTPNFARIGSWNVVCWMTLEQIKKAYLEYRDGKQL